ncbi:ParB/RepB/Spo0J family partition protein [Chelatococcus composti]|jgi:ParB family chromosome partitioning protein|uniref:ParB family chromosome partitioning protein n=1 Tax=Chelatococcus composti TaxID=1743235 RepID=A0A841KBT5_9HYPH|nr:ParB/RepB/Spo0J family partition protein [Chelatococcus composti]MBB6167466.1 ParB family chromosome partitioning protein [Chelatococcus composti]MBS7735671.1 ParB/RepB/Spo0J family partition protein [Chelatococcus composti]PZN46212.1 MAG: chromosome partitioning protein ParB [Pseudomonadota bacterium]GGG32143.1 chromosome partitioning protein ParB [Chelatococcus composti]
MVDDPARSRLGRGLAALIGEVGEDFGDAGRAPRGQRTVPIEFLRPNPRNPRKVFDDEALEELASSIRERGLIQPIIVRAVPNLLDVYEIIAGERRWRGAQRAGLHEVPVVVIEADDRLALEIAIIENVQRTDLNPIEEAIGYEQLMAEFHYSQNDLAQVIGKSRSHVANTLRLLRLPDSIKRQVNDGILSAGHARALLSVRDPEAVAERIIAQGLNVRDVERIAQEEARGSEEAASRQARPRREKDPDTRALEQALEEVLGLAVSVEHKAQGGGEVRIRYKTLEQLDALCRRLRG